MDDYRLMFTVDDRISRGDLALAQTLHSARLIPNSRAIQQVGYLSQARSIMTTATHLPIFLQWFDRYSA